MDTISASDIKAGEFFRVHINVVGLTINENDRCDCVVQQEKLNPDGMGGGSLGALYSKAQNGALEIRIGATPSIYADKIISNYNNAVAKT